MSKVMRSSLTFSVTLDYFIIDSLNTSMSLDQSKLTIKLPSVSRALALFTLSYLAFSFFRIDINLNTAEDLRKDCGIVYFYHTPKTGGTSIQNWLKQLCETEQSRCKYVELFYFDFKNNWELHQETMEENIDSLGISGEKPWRFFHHHWFQKGMNYTHPYLKKWRAKTEERGCQFVAITVFRDPLQKFLSQLLWDDVPYDEILEKITDDKRYISQLYGFLYNELDHIQNVTLERKISRGMEILDNFEVAMTYGMSDLCDRISDRIEFPKMRIPHDNKHTRSYKLTYVDLKKIWRTEVFLEDQRWILDIIKHFNL